LILEATTRNDYTDCNKLGLIISIMMVINE